MQRNDQAKACEKELEYVGKVFLGCRSEMGVLGTALAQNFWSCSMPGNG